MRFTRFLVRLLTLNAMLMLALNIAKAQTVRLPTASDPDPIPMTANNCLTNYLGAAIANGTWTLEFVDNNNTPTVFTTGTNQVMTASTMSGVVSAGTMINPRTNTGTFNLPNPALTSLNGYGLHITILDKATYKVTEYHKMAVWLNDVAVSGSYTTFNLCKANTSLNNSAAPLNIVTGPTGSTGPQGPVGLPGVATYTGNTNTPGATDVTLMSGSDVGARLNTCIAAITSSAPSTGGICEMRNANGEAQTMTTAVTVNQDNITINLPCGTITTATTFTVAAGVRNTTLHGCSNRGGSSASGLLGGSVWVYTGSGNAFNVGDPTYAVSTSGFHMDNVSLVTASNTAASAAMRFYTTQEIDIHNIYMNGPQSINAGNVGIFLDGTSNYSGGTFDSIQISGYTEPLHLDGHLSGTASGDFANASAFNRMHIVCPTSGGSPITGSIGINIVAGDGNTFTGGDVEGCDVMTHLGPNAINNTILGLRNERSNTQFIADSGAEFNNVVVGGTLFQGQLIDNGSRNSFQDAFHYNFNGYRGNWYASIVDQTLTNHVRVGIGVGNERGIADEYQTDFGYRWMVGLGDGGTGAQSWFVLDELSNVARFAANQYLTASTGGVLVTNVIVNNGGCFSTPTAQIVTFTGGGATTQATGVTVMGASSCSGGYQVLSVTMTSGGAGYTTQPTATVDPTYESSAPHLVAEITSSGSSNNQTIVNSTGVGAVVINGTNNSGTGGVVLGSGGANAQTNASPWSVTASGNMALIGAINMNDTSNNQQWQIEVETSDLSFAIRNSNNPSNPAMLHAVQNNSLYLNSAGAYNVEINSSVGAGTGGFAVYAGGPTPSPWFSVGNAGYTKVTALAGSGHRCVYADSSGGLNVEGSDCGTSNSNGTITSLGLTMPADFTVSNSPITSSGNLAVAYATEVPNVFLAGPASGGTAATPTWRAIVAADVPTLNQSTTGTAANVTATSNGTLTTLSALSLPYSQLTGTPSLGTYQLNNFTSPIVISGSVISCANCATTNSSPTFTGNTFTLANNAAATDYLIIQPGTSGTAEIGAVEFASATGSAEWEMRDDAAYNFHLHNTGGTSQLDVLVGYVNQSTNLNSQQTYPVYINGSTNAGTGGAVIESGGSSPIIWMSVTGSTTIKIPGLLASSGHYGLQIDTSGYVTNTGAAPGTVTSVGLTMPADFSLSGCTITTSGTCAITRASETANYFLAAPNGSAGTPLYRAIVAADLPVSISTVEWSTASTSLCTTAGTACYMGVGYTGGNQSKGNFIAPRAGVVKNCAISVGFATTSSNYYTAALWKNGSVCTSGPNMVLNTGSNAVVADYTDSCTVAQGDKLSWALTPTGTVTGDVAAATCQY